MNSKQQMIELKADIAALAEAFSVALRRGRDPIKIYRTTIADLAEQKMELERQGIR